MTDENSHLPLTPTSKNFDLLLEKCQASFMRNILESAWHDWPAHTGNPEIRAACF